MCFVAFVCLSDDELTPYDMSGDQEMSRASPPRYLRDCLEGRVLFILTSTFSPDVTLQKPVVIFAFLSTDCPALISSEDSVRVELSLRAAEDLVRKNVFAAKEVGNQTGVLFLLLMYWPWNFYCSEIVPSLQLMLLCLYFRSASSWLKFFFTWRINTASMASWDSDRRPWWRWPSLILSLYDLKYLFASTFYFGFPKPYFLTAFLPLFWNFFFFPARWLSTWLQSFTPWTTVSASGSKSWR